MQASRARASRRDYDQYYWRGHYDRFRRHGTGAIDHPGSLAEQLTDAAYDELNAAIEEESTISGILAREARRCRPQARPDSLKPNQADPGHGISGVKFRTKPIGQVSHHALRFNPEFHEPSPTNQAIDYGNPHGDGSQAEWS